MSGLKISLAIGGVRLPGWTHVDGDPQWEPDVTADLSQPLPFPDQSAAFLQSEDFIGQLTFPQAEVFFRECFRVLRPGGVMRLLTPDLALLVTMYQQRDYRLREFWDEGVGIPLHTRTLGELVHKALTFAQQQSFYDEETLRALLEPIGFRVKRVTYQQSAHPELRGLDQRSPADAISLYLECTRPHSSGI